MIEKLHIENFQSHAETPLEFHPGVNVIVGSSDSGKSAVLRALRWVVYNKPTGDAFRRIGTKKTSVELVMDGQVITREKSASINTYQLGKQLYKAFGNDIPTDIAQVINLSDVNVQKQLDAPYLLSETPGEVARQFNRIAHLEKIDRGNSILQSKLRKLNATFEVTTEGLADAKEQLQEYAYIPEMENMVAEYEALLYTFEQHTIRVMLLENLLKRLSAIQNNRQLIEQETIDEILVDDLLQKYKYLKGLHSRLQGLQTIIDKLNGITYRRDKITRNLEQSEITASKVEKLLNDIEGYKKQETLLESRKMPLNRFLRSLKKTQQEITALRGQIKKDETYFHKMMPEECPLCGTILKK